ncbi:nucleoid occlusion protein [Lactobacillus kefiranofaciens]|uniref:Chromosome partitioning protein, ParB family n=1 Tax=Lactobacillus kefiranofaciens TaxID=267818 RepID=A0AAX3UCW8_9LACO|nr:nucleoid occlusion protein [Lactobacillus kefiranofaciens]AEG41061.1 Chromosome partitioning protein [Lactobacillus kefiranofaciens subsp. kefiranofaciens]KRL29767.1 chromosome partitioning protein [Lactobacillus kefiranofaciens subsp. kefirgranum DSM 10550 = JCM 8572]KRM20851.1 chromosome partitioning protein [Lactobacillus kefiranofaciens subsp. kefiranofaciens DSM 5016 = JCM 6985]MCJ2172299.1 nucleoid occlusion protein [Lactobacillus kefiranofaciens]QFQ68708.1 nucleoid occlusion protein 
MSLFSFMHHDDEVPKNKQIQDLELDKIVPNRYQPRREFSDNSIKELAKTLDQDGLLQPIVVREDGDQYEIIAGERRYRAAKSLGWDTIPAIVKNMDDDQAASLALIENLQREDLNPIDEAKAYTNLMKLNDLTQTALAKDMGKSQSYVANKLRLLKLGDDVQEALIAGKITARHGRALIGLNDEDQKRVLAEIEEKGLNVKQTEAIAQNVDEYFNPKREKKEKNKPEQKVTSRIPKDLKVQINTIKKAVKLAKDSGIRVKVKEDKNPDDYKITIELKRK